MLEPESQRARAMPELVLGPFYDGGSTKARITTNAVLSFSLLTNTPHTSPTFQSVQLQGKGAANVFQLVPNTYQQDIQLQSSTSPPASASSFSSLGSNRNPSNPGWPSRPGLIRHKSSGTLIVPRDCLKSKLEEDDETFDSDDAHAMSPRRTSEDLEKMSQDARTQLSQSVPSVRLLIYDIASNPSSIANPVITIDILKSSMSLHSRFSIAWILSSKNMTSWKIRTKLYTGI
jgi:hypothetical protein